MEIERKGGNIHSHELEAVSSNRIRFEMINIPSVAPTNVWEAILGVDIEKACFIAIRIEEEAEEIKSKYTVWMDR